VTPSRGDNCPCRPPRDQPDQSVPSASACASDRHEPVSQATFTDGPPGNDPRKQRTSVRARLLPSGRTERLSAGIGDDRASSSSRSAARWPARVTDTRGRASRDFADGRRSPRLGDPPQARREHAPSSNRQGGAARDHAPGGRVANPRWGDAPSTRQQPACRRVRFPRVPGGGLKGRASRWATFSCQGGGALR
jgi:hypothetical protein